MFTPEAIPSATAFMSWLMSVWFSVIQLLMPATTEVAPMWRESVDTDFVWQLPWSLTGSPVVVMPYGTDGALPVAIQIVSQRWNDHIVLAVARALDEAGR